LRLVLGPANSAKAGEVLGGYAAAARRGAVLVVPTAADAQLYTRELAAGGTVLGGSVVTFAGLAREIARRTGFRGRRASRLARERLLARAVAGVRLSVLERSAGASGFATAVGELVAELERSLVTPQRFASALTAWAGDDGARSAYARELGGLYQSYVRELERGGLVDGDLYAWRALDALRASPGRWGTDAVFFYGFDDLVGVERDAIETLARIADASVTVSLTYEAGREALSARAETVEDLRALAAEVIELPALDEWYAAGSRVALHHVERRLFEPCPDEDRIDPGDAVQLLEAGGERAEAELVAAEVLALLRAGVPGQEIVVCHRSPGRIGPLFERVFSAYGIALGSERSVPFAHTALGTGLLALARCALVEDADASDLLAYLRTPGLLELPSIADELEASLVRAGPASLADARELLGWDLGELDAVRRDPFAELPRQARRILAAPVRGAAAVLEGSASLDARALRMLVRALEELDALGERPGGAELVALLAELPVPAGAATGPGVVLLADPLAIRARRFRAVFVCGLCEGEFPLASGPEPFLSDERRFELAAASGLRLGAREDSLARERYLLYACVSRATERVVLSYRSSDEEGNLALPSPFIADMAELFVPEWRERRRTRLLADVVWPADAAPTERERLRAEAAAAAPAGGSDEDPARWSLSAEALGLVRHREILSAGALESFADCPVKWLVDRELQPARFEPEPEALARGSFMHDVLERLLRSLGGPVTPASLPRALQLLEQLLADVPATIAAGRPAAVRAAAVRSIEADLCRYLEWEAANGPGWRQAGLELRFGFGEPGPGPEGDSESLPALELAPGVLVRGLIDRVETDGAGHAIVIDYKSRGRDGHRGARWELDRQLQVALYMLAVKRLLGLEPVAGFYQPLGGEKLAGRGLFANDVDVGSGVVPTDGRTEEELSLALDDTAARAVALAERLRAGELTPCPETCSRNGCAFPGICRVV
jgi:ATP-dependent helicase/DNAse subunit B